MLLLGWLRVLVQRLYPASRRTRRRRGTGRRLPQRTFQRVCPRVEALESRVVPATYFTSGADLYLDTNTAGLTNVTVVQASNTITVTLAGDTWTQSESVGGVTIQGDTHVLTIDTTTFTGALSFSNSGDLSYAVAFTGGTFSTGVSGFFGSTGAVDVSFTSATSTFNAGLTIVADNANSDITQTAAIVVYDPTQLQVGGDIDLSHASNDFVASISNNAGTVLASANDISINDQNALILGATTASGTLTVTAGSTLGTAGTIAATGTASLTSVGALTLSNQMTIAGSATLSATGSTSDVTVQANIIKGTGAEATLTLKAADDVLIKSSADITANVGANKLNVVLRSDSDGSGAGGIRLESSTGSEIRSRGGNISLLGGVDPNQDPAKGTADTGAVGVTLGNLAKLVADGGAIVIRGQGQNGTPGHGILVQQGASIETSTGSITLVGQGGNDAGDGGGVGVEFDGTGRILSTSGVVSVTGTGGTGTGSNHHGVFLQNTASIQVTNAPGSISVTGTGGSNNSAGVRMANSARITSAGSAAITITGTGSGTSAGLDSASNTTPSIGGAADTGAITIVTDTYNFSDGTIRSTGVLVIKPKTASTTVGIGGGAGTLNVDDAEISRLTDGFSSITIGDTAAGTALVTVDTATFTDAVTIAGGAISVIGSDSVAGVNAASETVTLIARNGAITHSGTTNSTDVAGAVVSLTANSIGTVSNSFALSSTGLSTNTSTTDGDQYLKAVGTVTIAAGGLNAGNGSIHLTSGLLALGGSERVANASKLFVETGATFSIASNDETVNTLVIAGGTITGDSTGSTGLTSTAQIDARSGTVSAILKGGAGLAKTTSGTLILTGNNSYSSGTTIAATGTLQIGNGGSSGTLGSGNVVNDGALVFNRDSGSNVSVGNDISGTGTFTKSGTSTLTLSGTNTYTGLTTVSNGRLNVTGTLSGDGNSGTTDVTVASTAILGGTGTISGKTSVSGTLAPGARWDPLESTCRHASLSIL